MPSDLYPREWMYKRGEPAVQSSSKRRSDPESRLIRGERFAGNIDAEAGILRTLTILGRLIMGPGGSIVDADGSVWDQSGITLAATSALSDQITAVRSGFDNQSWKIRASIDTNITRFTLAAHWDDGALTVRNGGLVLEAGDTAAETFATLEAPRDPAGPFSPSISVYQNGQAPIYGYFGFPPYDATISGGSASLDPAGWLRLDTEGGAASDDLDNIVAGTGFTLMSGQILIVTAANSARTVSVTEAGNIELSSAPFALDNAEDTLTLLYNGSAWIELARSNNGA